MNINLTDREIRFLESNLVKMLDEKAEALNKLRADKKLSEEILVIYSRPRKGLTLSSCEAINTHFKIVDKAKYFIPRIEEEIKLIDDILKRL